MLDIALIRGPYLRSDGIRPWEELDKRKKYNVVAFESDPPGHDTSNVSIPVEQLQLPAATIRRIVGDSFIPNVASSYLRGIRNLSDRFDVLHTSENYNIFSLQAALTTRSSKTKFVFSAGQNIPYPLSQRNLVLWKIKQYINKAADGITTTTPLGKRAHIHEGVQPEKIRVIPNCVDPQKFKPSNAYGPEDIGLPNSITDHPVILFGHQLSEQKGVPYLLSAFKALRQQLSCNMILLGENLLSTNQYKKISNNEAIYHLEHVPYTKMVALYNIADVFVLPSVTMVNNEEQFGMCALEAMACGVPTVVTKTGGLPYVAEHGKTSRVVEERNPNAIADALELLLENDKLRRQYSSNARQRATTAFHPTHVADLLDQFYTKLVV